MNISHPMPAAPTTASNPLHSTASAASSCARPATVLHPPWLLLAPSRYPRYVAVRRGCLRQPRQRLSFEPLQ